MAIILALAVLGGVSYYVTRPQRLAGYLSDLASSLTGADIRIGQAHLLTDGLDLQHITVRAPNLEGPAGNVLTVANLRIKTELTGLLYGETGVGSIVAVQPRLHLTQDQRTGKYNYQSLISADDKQDDDSQWTYTALPDVFLRHGNVYFATVDDAGNFTQLGELPLEGHFAEDESQNATYQFALRQAYTLPTDPQQQGVESGPIVRGMLDLARQTYAVELDGLELDQNQKRLLPQQLRELWERLDPRGSLPIVTFKYDHDSGDLHAELQVDGVALTLPIPELDARLSDVAGKFILDNKGVSIETLTGELEGVRYSISGRMRGHELDAPFELNMQTKPFDVPEELPHIAALPAKALKHYQRFQPHGKFQIAAELQRLERGSKLKFKGVIDLLGVYGKYYKFPYPLEDVRGRIRISDDQVVLENMTGKSPSGGSARIYGTITPPGDGAAVDLHIEAENIKIDQHLLEALEPKHRKVFDLFLNEDRYKELAKQGVIRSAGGDQAMMVTAPTTNPDAPVFDLGGAISLNIHVTREFGPDHRNEVNTTVRGQGVRIVMKHWPYPVQAVAGELEISRHAVQVRGIKIRGLTGATATINGSVDHENGDVTPDLKVTDARLPIDDVLLASLPSPQDQWLRQLALGGAIDATANIFKGKEHDVDYKIDMAMTNGTIQPNHGAFALDRLTGKLTMLRSAIELYELTGKHGDDASLSAKGVVAWDTGKPTCDLLFTGENLPIQKALLDVLPEQAKPVRDKLLGLIDKYNPAGRFGAEIAYKHTEDEQDIYAATLTPEQLAFDMAGKRASLTNITGTARAQGEQLELHDIAADFAKGSLKLTGLIGLDDKGGAALRLSAQGSAIDNTTYALMPTAVRSVVDALELRGGYDIKDARILYRPTVTQGPRVEFEGTVHLRDSGATVGVPITNLMGQMDVRVAQFASSMYPHVNIAIQGDELRAAGRLVKPLSLNVVTSDKVDVLELRDLHGEVYGGTLIGSGQVGITARGQYRVDLTLQDVAVEPFLFPADQPNARDGQPLDDTGKLSASLTLEALYSEPQSKRGRGALDIRGAQLFERPLTMALLQAANLALPTSDAFDRASAQYLIDGNTVRFDDIRFETPSVAMAGAGVMDYPTQELHLTMFARDSAGPRLGLITEMINIFKDQLICVEVKGTLEKPAAKMVSFEGLRDSWQDLFGKTDRGRDTAVHPQ